jgi:hypothetical protein
VTYVPANNTFDGHSGDSVSLVFAGTLQPWAGAIVKLAPQGSWFVDDQMNGVSYADLPGGSIDAGVVPAPAAVLLGMLGLGAVGLGMRRFV